MQNKRILITGAGRGIGYALAAHALERGATVGINYLEQTEGPERLKSLGADRAILLPFDVRDPDAVDEGVGRFSKEAGGLDCLINNAGVASLAPLIRLKPDAIRKQIEVNLLGAIYCARAALNKMRRAKAGTILQISSVAGDKPEPGQAVYAASKGGLEALGRAVAVEAARWNIRVLNIILGPVQTGLYHTLSDIAVASIDRRMILGKPPTAALAAERIFAVGLSDSGLATGADFRLDMGYSLG